MGKLQIVNIDIAALELGAPSRKISRNSETQVLHGGHGILRIYDNRVRAYSRALCLRAHDSATEPFPRPSPMKWVARPVFTFNSRLLWIYS